jgi:tRNA threonylcarbamoyl adenosine modification protein (Sua5/YciO/YrdC/YwlC family)
MKTFFLEDGAPAYGVLREVADIILSGGVVIYPTDTIYGLGCDAFSKTAIQRITRIKRREDAKPFSFICQDVAQISEFAFVSNWAYKLMNRLLPGPYTFILEARKTNLPKKMVGRRNTVGVRIPDNLICKKLVELAGRPLVSTSVNVAGGEPAEDIADIPEDQAALVDAAISIGPLHSGPSTVVDLRGSASELIRAGRGAVAW